MFNHFKLFHPQYVFPPLLSAKKQHGKAFKAGKQGAEGKVKPAKGFEDEVADRANPPSGKGFSKHKIMDSSNEYTKNFREHSRFGSHPSHDSFDDESDAY